MSSTATAPAAQPQPTGQTPRSYTETFRGRSAHSQFADPCEEARKQSMKCLDDNAYNKSKCTNFFQAYRDCKSDWLNQRREDRRAGRDVA
ncbi:protein of MTCP1 family [Pseudohyphozyma bogoriensis]|nr:protein of MTCP1 family [Pseudohyphozyma bogoriensis]